MKIKSLGNHVQISTTFKPETIAKIKQYVPDALCVKNDTGHALFMIDTGITGSVTRGGIVFNTKDAKGNAAYEFDFDGEISKEILAERYATILDMGSIIEEQIVRASLDLADIEEHAMSRIEIIG